MYKNTLFKCPLCVYTHKLGRIVAVHYKRQHGETFAESIYEDYDYEVHELHLHRVN